MGDTAADRPDVAPGAGNPVVGGPDRYFDPNAFQLQPVGIIGNSGVATMMGPGLALMDVSLLKRLTFGKGMGVELRTEVFNLLNRPNLGIPDNVLFNTDGTRRGAAGRISSTLTTPREFQFSVKFIF